MENKKKFFIASLLFLIFIAVLAVIGYFFGTGKHLSSFASRFNKVDYLIPGVPYYGMHNHVGKGAEPAGDLAQVTLSIIDYWNPGSVKVQDVNENIGVSPQPDKIIYYVANLENGSLLAERRRLEFHELKNYINEERRVPLLAFLPLSTDQADGINYYMANILIGYSDTRQMITVHSPWLGNNQEITFADFKTLWEKVPAERRNDYIIIEPTNFDEKINELRNRSVEPYPRRTEVMTKGEKMLANYVIGKAAYNGEDFGTARSALENVMIDPNFADFFPPAPKVNVYSFLADIYMGLSKSDEAMMMAMKAVEIDHDLDQPFRDWPGFETSINSVGNFDKINQPYRILGDLYRQKGDLDQAKVNYEKAIEIYPENAIAKMGLEVVKGEMAK